MLLLVRQQLTHNFQGRLTRWRFLASVVIVLQCCAQSVFIIKLQQCAAPPPEGDTIIKEGDDDRSLFKFYIVEEGEARAYVHEDGEDVLMSHLHPGEIEISKRRAAGGQLTVAYLNELTKDTHPFRGGAVGGGERRTYMPNASTLLPV